MSGKGSSWSTPARSRDLSAQRRIDLPPPALPPVEVVQDTPAPARPNDETTVPPPPAPKPSPPTKPEELAHKVTPPPVIEEEAPMPMESEPPNQTPVIPTDIRVPRSGASKWYYAARKFFGHPENIPKLNKNDTTWYDERDQIAEQLRLEMLRRQDLMETFEAQGAEINHLVKIDKVRLTLAVANQTGGGSKTWFSNHFACEAAETLRLPVAVIEGRRNAAVGWMTLGVDPDATVSSRQLYAMREEIRNANDLSVATSTNRYGVISIKTDPETPSGDAYTGEQAGETLELVSDQVPIVVDDTGNTPTDDINLGMCKKTKVGAFVTIPTEESLTLCADTVKSFHANGLEELVRNSFYVVNMLRPGMNVEDFRGSDAPDVPLRARKLAAPADATLLSTYYDAATDTTWSATSQLTPGSKVIDLDKLQLETRVALREAIIVALKLRKAQMDDEQQTKSNGLKPDDPATSAADDPRQ